ncbi:peptidylprolyl isomerase [Paraoerskovia sediminicola]|uniref:peptidylprolyl isomerase n=1 Tax=Paraoerskovia sediminicola TaxID=1138587 RepID=A0ABN6XDR8_9CELL|nr:FKBP-type peptidyl-prolyl cis-trans isomerase [Paraoerskovia sediminicola]BDZ42979.1 peptidylprolyl isomerase [Paraoerskovia sediminicola]
MKNRTLRGITALTLGSALVLAGCSGGDDADPGPTASAESTDAAEAPGVNENPDDIATLEAVEVSGDVGSEPTVEFDAPLEVSGPTAVVATEGDGDTLEDGMRVTMNIVNYQGSDAERTQSTWDEGATPQVFTLGDPQYDLINPVLTGTTIGSRIVFGNLSADADGNPTTLINVIEVTDATEPSGRERAEGEAVEPADGLPVVTLDDTGKPSIEIPDDYEAPDELVVQPLIKGDGPEVSADQSVSAHYTGWLLDGTQFDSSWDRGEPSDFPLSGVIEGWTTGLSGQTVGSQVLLVIPADLAYGDQESETIPADSTLVFVVDILDAY